MMRFLIRIAQEKRRHFIIEQTALHAIREVVGGFLKSPVTWDVFAHRGEGLGQDILIPIGIGNEQEISALIAEPIGQRGKEVDR